MQRDWWAASYSDGRLRPFAFFGQPLATEFASRGFSHAPAIVVELDPFPQAVQFRLLTADSKAILHILDPPGDQIVSVRELEAAVTELPPEELAAFARWFEEYVADAWDRQIEEDIRAGQLDKAGKQADADFEAGRCKPL